MPGPCPVRISWPMVPIQLHHACSRHCVNMLTARDIARSDHQSCPCPCPCPCPRPCPCLCSCEADIDEDEDDEKDASVPMSSITRCSKPIRFWHSFSTETDDDDNADTDDDDNADTDDDDNADTDDDDEALIPSASRLEHEPSRASS